MRGPGPPPVSCHEETRDERDGAAPPPTAGLPGELLAAKAGLEARNDAPRLVNDLSHRRLDVKAFAAETVELLPRRSQVPFSPLDGGSGQWGRS